jgi:hypothetical protein
MNEWVKEEPVPSRVYFVNGPSTFSFNANNLSEGLYSYKMEATFKGTF